MCRTGKGRKPRIGITTGNAPFSPSYLAVWCAVWLAGGRPVRLRLRPAGRTPVRRLLRLLRTRRRHALPGPLFSHGSTELSGIIISGGPHVHPQLYHAPAAGTVSGVRRKNFISRARVLILRRAALRDVAEAGLAVQCRERGVPLLGICRGAQVMAVAADGSLHPSVRSAFRGARYPHHPLGYMTFRKQITIEQGSALHRILGTTELAVNSLHRQAVATLPDDLPVTARESNGVVQAFEDPSHPFFIGVQFHPELLVHRVVYRRLFRALTAAAQKSSGMSLPKSQTIARS